MEHTTLKSKYKENFNTKTSMLYVPCSTFHESRGQALLIFLVFFLFTSLALIFGLVNPSTKVFQTAQETVRSRQSYLLAESGIEDVIYRLKNNMSISATESINLNSSSALTTLTDLGSGRKEVVAVGDVASRERMVKVEISTGVGSSFNYGIQAGSGGIIMANNAGISGNVYSNGDIIGSNGAYITGTTYVADSASLYADQANELPMPVTSSVMFGNTSGTQDFAQSFQLSTSGPINKVQLYIKRTSTIPANLTVRITTDNNGAPSTSTIVSSTLSASSVGTSYPSSTWIEVPFSSNPDLTAGITYWLVLDGSTGTSTKNYTIGANSTYENGSGKVGTFSGAWSATSPVGLDGYFKVYLGGQTGSISNMLIGTAGTGDANAYTVTGTTVQGFLYCQTGSGNNKACNSSAPVPGPQPFPVSQANIDDWKDDAAEGGTHIGNYTTGGNLGPRKITGDLTLSNNITLTLTGTVWVQGNLILNNNIIVNLAPGYASGSGMIIVDGTVSLSNNVIFNGSGTPGSYVMVVSNSYSESAISVGNNAGTVILYAPNGTISFSNNSGAKEAAGFKLSLGNNAVIVYETGLANVNFTSGPSGGYEVESWQETQ